MHFHQCADDLCCCAVSLVMALHTVAFDGGGSGDESGGMIGSIHRYRIDVHFENLHKSLGSSYEGVSANIPEIGADPKAV